MCHAVSSRKRGMAPLGERVDGMKRWILFGSFLVLALWLLAWIWFPPPATPQVSAVLSVGSQADRASVVTGPPTISAAFITRVLETYHSPAVSKGQALYDLGVKYGIDPVYALAFFWHESDFGTTGEARVTYSLGNERCVADRPCIDRHRGGYALMQSWEDGFDQWYRLIWFGYVQGQVTRPLVGHVCPTVDEIVPVYAPGRDGNDVAAYIAAVTHAVDTWRHGGIQV